MQKVLIIFSCAILSAVVVTAQHRSSGIYLTQSDFENRKLSYSTNHASEKNKLQFHELFYKPYITVKHNGEKTIFFKDDVFAYQKNGKVFRARDFVSYNFVEQGVIWIYFKEQTVQLGKGVKRERKYYYSVSGKDKIIPLTIYNLKKSFPSKHTFHNFLEAQFRSDADLASYNQMERKYRVNQLLETTIFNTPDTVP